MPLCNVQRHIEDPAKTLLFAEIFLDSGRLLFSKGSITYVWQGS